MEKLGNLFAALRERRLWHVAIAYAVIAWGAAQVVQFAFENYEISRKYLDVTLLLLALGFPAALTITWYHGEKGHQRATRLEILILASLTLLAGIGTWRITRAEREFDLSADEVVMDLGQESVAVLPFENRVADPDLDWLGAGIAELITTGLAQIPDLAVVSGQRLFDLMRHEGRADVERIPDALASRIATRAGARFMVDGSILGRADDITINASLIDVASGRVVAAAKARGADVFVLVDSISGQLSNRILGAAAEPTEVASVADVTTGNLEAYRAYQLGLESERRWHLRDAFRQYRQAVALDPTFAIAQIRLARIAFENGDLTTGLHALRAAQDNRERATGRDRLFLDGMLAEMVAADRDAAVEAYRELARQYPDDKEGRYRLSLIVGQDSEDSRRLLEETVRLDPLFAPAYNQLAYWYARHDDFAAADSVIAIYLELEPDQPNPRDSRGEIREMAGDYEGARAAYREALRVRPDFTISLNHLARSWILYENRPDEAVSEMEPYTRDTITVVRVRALGLTSDALMASGDIDAGIEVARQAEAEAASAGETQSEMQIIIRLLPTYVSLGDYDALNAAVGRLQLIDPVNPAGPFFGLAALGAQGQLEVMRRLGDRIRGGVAQDPDMAGFLQIVTAFIDSQISFYTGDYERSALLADSVRKQGGMPFLGNYAEIISLLEIGQADAALNRALVLERDARNSVGRAEPVQLRMAYYFQARALEQSGQIPKAIEAYERALDGWEEAARRFPIMSDATDRLAALRAAG